MADAHWFESEGDVAKGVSEGARFADLVILGQDEYQEPPETHPLPVVHSVVPLCGRPVLVVPPGVQSLVPVNAALVWDGSREAVRATHDALPLLKLARRVDVVTIRPFDDVSEVGGDSLVTHLAHHGITAETRVEHVARSDERSTFHTALESGRYDLVVMGGHSHPKWLEFIFGGMTLTTLLKSNITVLVSH